MTYKNIKPDLWGPHLWRFLHYLSLSYPSNPTDEEKEIMLNFLESLQEILPCEKCRYNFNKHLDNLDMNVLNSNESFIKWLFNIHNEVNKSNNKPVLEYSEFINMYSNQNQVTPVTEISEVVQNKPVTVTNKSYKNYLLIGILVSSLKYIIPVSLSILIPS